MGALTTHVLDTAQGTPAADIEVTLSVRGEAGTDSGWRDLATRRDVPLDPARDLHFFGHDAGVDPRAFPNHHHPHPLPLTFWSREREGFVPLSHPFGVAIFFAKFRQIV